VKRHTADPTKTYPDMGACFEMFANADVLELETLGPLTKLAPGESLRHVERWSLYRDVRIGEWTDAELDRVLAPLGLFSFCGAGWNPAPHLRSDCFICN